MRGRAHPAAGAQEVSSEGVLMDGRGLGQHCRLLVGRGCKQRPRVPRADGNKQLRLERRVTGVIRGLDLTSWGPVLLQLTVGKANC